MPFSYTNERNKARAIQQPTGSAVTEPEMLVQLVRMAFVAHEAWALEDQQCSGRRSSIYSDRCRPRPSEPHVQRRGIDRSTENRRLGHRPTMPVTEPVISSVKNRRIVRDTIRS